MKKTIYILTMLLFITAGAFAQGAGDKILGNWFSENKSGEILVYQSDGKYYGKLVGGNNLYETDGKTPRKDIKNSDEKLQTRTLINLVILSDFTYKNSEYTGGKIYDPQSGKTYKCNMKLAGNELNIRGYVGIPMFGRTSVWTRAQ